MSGPVEFLEVSFPWPEEGGPWVVRADVALVDGRRVVVGLHLTSYTVEDDEDGATLRIPGPHGLTEVTHAVVRGLKMGQMADTARMMLAPNHAPSSASDPTKVRAWVKEWLG